MELGMMGLTSPRSSRERRVPYERLLSDVMAGDLALFTREDALDTAWEVVEPVLTDHDQARPYRRGSCGPGAAGALIAPDGCWHNPQPGREPGGTS